MSEAVLRSGITRKRFVLGEERHTKLMTPSVESRRQFPFYWMLIDSGIDNPVAMLAWKIYARERALTDLEFRNSIKEMCRLDVAFYACTLVWIFEPRPTPRHLPYCPWVDQVDLMAWADECFPERSLGNEKTRGIGVTWLYTTFFSHKWYFIPDCRIAVLTKDKDLLESQDDNSLIGKFVFIHEHMPFWMKYDKNGNDIMQRSIENHQLTNEQNKAFIRGYLSTNTKVRSLRFTAIWGDEIAFWGRDAQEWMVSAGGTTLCRFMTSTWNCLGADTRVLTHRGTKPILEVQNDDLLWDGVEWVHHNGLVFSGVRDTIYEYGAWMTPDHTVLTNEGWRHAKHRIKAKRVAKPEARAFRRRTPRAIPHIPSVVGHDSALYESEQHSLQELRRQGNNGLQTLADVPKLPDRHGRAPEGYDSGSKEQQSGLQQEQLPVGDSVRTIQEYSCIDSGERPECVPVGGRGRRVPEDDPHPNLPGLYGRAATSAEQTWSTQPVYDLVNAGPRHRFTIVAPDGTLTVVLNSFGDMFNHIMHEDESTMLRVFSYWQNNSERWKGAYYMQNGRVRFVDKDYHHTPDYQFGEPDIMPEGTLRSPWVDGELLEPGVDPYKTLRDIYGPEVCERDAAFFKPEFRRALESSKQVPDEQGNISVLKPNLELIPTLKSEIKIWGDTSEWESPIMAGFDLAFGRGAHNSVMEVVDGRGHQIMEYCTNTTALKDFAQNGVKIAKWIEEKTGHTVTFDFEANGNGAQDFWEELERLRYGYIHKTRKAPGTKNTKKRHGVFDSRYHGTWNSDGGHANFTELERAVLSMSLVVKSEGVWEESKLFGIDDKGQPSFPRMNRIGHGDRMAALGIVWNRIKSHVRAAKQEAASVTRAFETPRPNSEPVASFDGYANSLWSNR